MASVLLGVVLVLFIGGQTQRWDSFAPYEAAPLWLPKALVLIHAPSPDEIVTRTTTLLWYRPEAIRPSFTVYAFDEAFETLRIREVQIVVNDTNTTRITNPDDGQSEPFKPYEDKEAFRAKYSGDPRYAFYMPFPKDPTLGSPSVGTKVRFRLDFDILSKGHPVCSTNYQADFILERKETKVSWAGMLFLKLFMPRF